MSCNRVSWHAILAVLQFPLTFDPNLRTWTGFLDLLWRYSAPLSLGRGTVEFQPANGLLHAKVKVKRLLQYFVFLNKKNISGQL